MNQVNSYLGIDAPEKLLDYKYMLQLSDIYDAFSRSGDKPQALEYIDYLKIGGCNIYNHLNTTTDEKRFVFEFIHKMTRSPISKQELSDILSNTTFNDPNCAFGDMQDILNNYEKLFIVEINDIQKVRAHLVSLKSDFIDMHKELTHCFKNLYFNEKHDYSKFNIKDIKEIIYSLWILNEQGMDIFIANHRHSGDALAVMQTHFNCSGENDAIRHIVNIDGTAHKIICNSHIKIGRGDSNMRIYFAWGNDDVANGKIIIYSIGGHI